MTAVCCDERTKENYYALLVAILTEKDTQEALRVMELVGMRELLSEGEREQRDAEIVRRSETGATPYRIAMDMGVHRQTVYNVLHKAGVRRKEVEG